MSSSAIMSSIVMSARRLHDLGAARVAVELLEAQQLLLDLLSTRRSLPRMARKALDRRHQLAVLLHHLLALEAGQALQAHVEDRLRLHVGEREADHQRSRASPGSRLERMVAITFVEVVERLENAFQDVGAFLGLAQVEARAADDHRLPVVEEALQQLLQRQHARLLVDDGEQDDAEGHLHRRQLVELVEHHLADDAALELDDDADAVAVALVAQVGEPSSFLPRTSSAMRSMSFFLLTW
jgi:hypothetical protein